MKKISKTASAGQAVPEKDAVKDAGTIPSPINRASLPTSGPLYWAVAYETNGTISLRPCGPEKEDAIKFLEDFFIGHPERLEACEASAVIRRDMGQIVDGWLFGHCKANDIVAKLKK